MKIILFTCSQKLEDNSVLNLLCFVIPQSLFRKEIYFIIILNLTCKVSVM